MIERIFSFLKWYHLYSKTLCSVRNNFFRNSFAISWNICILCVIRSQYLKFSPSSFNPGTIHFQLVRGVSKSKPGLNMITRGPSGDLIFSARARIRPPNVQPFQLVTVNSASLKLGTSEALLLKYLVCRAFPSTKQQLFPLRLEPGTSKHRLSPLPSHRLLCSSSAPLPPPLLPMVLTLIYKNTADPKTPKRSSVQNCEFHVMDIFELGELEARGKCSLDDTIGPRRRSL